jgi:hypothetical protein
VQKSNRQAQHTLAMRTAQSVVANHFTARTVLTQAMDTARELRRLTGPAARAHNTLRDRARQHAMSVSSVQSPLRRAIETSTVRQKTSLLTS